MEKSYKQLVNLRNARIVSIYLFILALCIARNDFGTRYSSLGYLNKFPLEKLKIDRSFITNIHQNNSNKAIVNAIITLAHSLGVLVVAEGIETKEELAL